jgi:hypothetical protein
MLPVTWYFEDSLTFWRTDSLHFNGIKVSQAENQWKLATKRTNL